MNKKIEENMAEWTKIIAKFPEANFLQSPYYGKMNELMGEKVITENFGGKGWALMIVRDAKRGRYLEIPCGPLMDWEDTELVKAVFEKIKQVGEREKCVFVRVRPQLPATPKNLQKLETLGLKKSPMHLAAEHTVVIDLRQPEEKLLANMRRQTRYEVRRADKLGIKVARSNSEDVFREFHQVQAETAKRQGFVPPNLQTLLAEREAFGEDIVIYTALISEQDVKSGVKDDTAKNDEAPDDLPKEQPIAYGLVIKNGREGDYYEAASTLLNRKLPGAYALLWRAMRDLKETGCERFNLWGIAPKGQPNHRYAGVTTFKTGFGGQVVEYVPAHDLVISHVGYLKDLVVEKARKKRRRL